MNEGEYMVKFLKASEIEDDWLLFVEKEDKLIEEEFYSIE